MRPWGSVLPRRLNQLSKFREGLVDVLEGALLPHSMSGASEDVHRRRVGLCSERLRWLAMRDHAARLAHYKA